MILYINTLLLMGLQFFHSFNNADLYTYILGHMHKYWYFFSILRKNIARLSDGNFKFK